MADYSAIISRFGFAKPSGPPNWWVVRCPCTENHRNGDRTPSGRVWIDEKTGDLRWHCFKGCKWAAVVAALGTEPRDWYMPKDPRERVKPMPRKEVGRWDYQDEAGAVLYQVVREEPKHFYQRRPIPGHDRAWANGLSEGWYAKGGNGMWGQVNEKYAAGRPGSLFLPEVRRVLYRLPRLLDPALAGEPVLVVEGEGKADLLEGLGFVATCNSGGSNKGAWKVEFGTWLSGRDVVVFPDTDAVGQQHAVDVAATALYLDAASVRIVKRGQGWENLKPPADVKDWLAEVGQQGGDKRQAVLDLIWAQSEWAPRGKEWVR